MNNKFNFSKKFRLANIFSLTLFTISVIFILFKGLNYGIDFKGGTLIELRSNNTDASTIRSILYNMDLGDVNVKKFGAKLHLVNTKVGLKKIVYGDYFKIIFLF